jgi:hypothetical protein
MWQGLQQVQLQLREHRGHDLDIELQIRGWDDTMLRCMCVAPQPFARLCLQNDAH